MPKRNSPVWSEPAEERAGQLRDFLHGLGLKVEKLSLIDQALTHSSYAFEHSLPDDNERLEFLGDTVIGFVVAEWLFATWPHSGEGELSKLKAMYVSRSALGQRAEALGLEDLLLLGKGDQRHHVRRRSSVLGSALEALVGAAYLQLPIEDVRQFVIEHVAKPSRNYLEQAEMRDFKSALQEVVQKEFHETPSYEIVSEKGPDHEKQFRVEVSIQGQSYGVGEGKRRKSAENFAAQMALAKLKEEFPASKKDKKG